MHGRFGLRLEDPADDGVTNFVLLPCRVTLEAVGRIVFLSDRHSPVPGY
jgi:hypothetical protein